MNTLTRLEASTGFIDPSSTDGLLAYLQRYGEPRLGMYDRGWHCSLEFFATGKGVKFSVNSDFGLQTPLAACQQCVDRLTETLSSLKQLA